MPNGVQLPDIQGIMAAPIKTLDEQMKSLEANLKNAFSSANVGVKSVFAAGQAPLDLPTDQVSTLLKAPLTITASILKPMADALKLPAPPFYEQAAAVPAAPSGPGITETPTGGATYEPSQTGPTAPAAQPYGQAQPAVLNVGSGGVQGLQKVAGLFNVVAP